ncbi:MAG: DUF6240 domain-containing protein [Candidatus Gastranaerophilales bacterium]|nr:DUF6240 domain-containing protein [Candidatus Gastranaerophilales bacterium]
MKITFQNHDVAETGKSFQERTSVKGGNGAQRASEAYQVSFQAKEDRMWAQDGMIEKEKGKSLSEIQQEAGNIDVGVQQDYMTVMSNTMSEEDYAELEKEGFHFQSMDPEEAVSIVDKIKAELARSGKDIEGYTDDLDMDTLIAAVGSEELARALAESFRKADVPLTPENIEKTLRAWDMASQLEQPTDGAYRYMIDNQMEPEIWDLYRAQSSGAQSMSGSPRYYAEEIPGYYTQSAQSAAGENLQEQIDRVIEHAGLEANEENRQAADFLLEQGLPLTEENLKRLKELQEVSFPVEERTFAEAAANAVAEGKDPVHANLSESENIYEKAQRVWEHYQTDVDLADLGDITARKQLEEIRLRMTAEVNVKLLKSGFAIDTAPMEQLLDALRRAEKDVADSYFPDDSQSVEKYHQYNETDRIVKELPGMPLQMMGSYSVRETDVSLSQFHEDGKALQETYEKANESYEALMTVPRKDLGDSIRKAFANVEDIVRDLGLEVNEENKRAIRILGYNHMDMTKENVEQVREAYEQVCSVIEKMTPASTLKMIRDGINPLEKSFEELERYFSDDSRTYEESAESYSRFLYGMEKNKEITEQEKDAYIGIYRLIRQIERSDGAVVGAVVNTQAELQFSNLLSAVRSNRFKGLDVKVEDSFGALAELVRKGESISDQISKGFLQDVKSELTEMSYSEESAAAYREEELAQIREAALTEEDAILLLQKGEIPANADNLLAAQALLHGEKNLFKMLQEQGKEEELPTDAWESLDEGETFREQYGQMIADMQTLVEETDLEQVESYVDLKDMQLVHKQLAVAGKLAASEEYILPMYIGEELTKIHLTLEHDEARKGDIHLTMEWSQEKRVEAHLSVKDDTVSGFLIGNTAEEVTKWNQAVDIFTDRLDMKVTELPVVSGNAYHASAGHPRKQVEKQDAATNADLYRVAKVFLQAVKEAEVEYENQL